MHATFEVYISGSIRGGGVVVGNNGFLWVRGHGGGVFFGFGSGQHLRPEFAVTCSHDVCLHDCRAYVKVDFVSESSL